MTSRRLRWASAGAGVLATPGLLLSALARPAYALDPGLVPADSDPRAVALLERASRAASEQAYAATQYVSTWGGGDSVSLVLEITHLPRQGSYVVLRDAGGRTGIPAFAADPVTGAGTLSVAGVDGGPLRLLPLNYELAVETSAREDANRVVARRADGSVAARFWLDGTTGMLMRREVYDVAGAVVRATATLDLRPVSDTPGIATLQSPPAPRARRLTAADVVALRDGGWPIPTSLAGQLLLYEARMLEVDGKNVIALSYSDGISAVSLFCQQGTLDPKALHGWRQEKIGSGEVYTSSGVLPRRLVWAGQGKVWTMLADAPLSTVTAVAAQLPHSPQPRRGPLGRLLDGLSRVASWLNPFD